MNGRAKLCFYLLFCLIGCAKEYSQEGGEPGTVPPTGPPAIEASWQFADEGNLQNGPTDSAKLSQQGTTSVLTISGPSTTGQRFTVVITAVNKEISPGNYTTSQGHVRFTYEESQSVLLKAIPSRGGDIHLKITAIDDKKVAGTFEGLAKSADGRSRVITEGKFSAPLQKADTINGTGTVNFWTRRLCNGPIRVKIRDTEKQITRIIYSPPLCSDTSFPSFELSPGNYTYTAYCGKDSIQNTVTIKPLNCTSVQIAFPFIPAEYTETKDSNCLVKSISMDGYYGNFFNAEFSGTTVRSISLPVDVYQGLVVTLTYFPVYTTGRIQVHEKEYFLLDGEGRISEFHGYQDPNTYMSTRVINRYYYNGSGYLDSITIEKESPRKLMRRIRFEWQEGKLLRMIDKHLLAVARAEIEIDYYNDKKLVRFPWLIEQVKELFIYQSLINFGKPLQYPIRTIRRKTYDEYNKLLSSSELHFDNYVIDGNNYVQGGRHEAVNSQYLRYQVRYHCP